MNDSTVHFFEQLRTDRFPFVDWVNKNNKQRHPMRSAIRRRNSTTRRDNMGERHVHFSQDNAAKPKVAYFRQQSTVGGHKVVRHDPHHNSHGSHNENHVPNRNTSPSSENSNIAELMRILTAEEKECLKRRVSYSEVVKGRNVDVHASNPIFIIASGSFIVFNGEEEVARLSKGSLFGFNEPENWGVSILRGLGIQLPQQNINIRACEDGEIMELSFADASEILGGNPAAMEFVTMHSL